MVEKGKKNNIIEGYHVPVLLSESIAGMNIHQGAVCVDVTFGGGGHSREILKQLDEKGRLYVFDQDADAIQNILNDERLVFIHSNFCFLKTFLRYHNVDKVDAVLADLGVSSHHLDDAERGFSFRYENSDLDMRMNKESKLTARIILNEYEESQLADVFYLYGELKQSRQIASQIVKKRKEKPFIATKDLLEVLDSFTSKNPKEKKILAQVFQALRIEVNQEMEVLKQMLLQAQDILKEGGRLVVITYHSLEDRLVKNFFKTGNFEGILNKDFYGNILTPFKAINNKVIVPSVEELESNSRSRSAKLRIVEKKNYTESV